jgi:demethylmenaquinone methyltransferase/2-methoxy-6-polyprenyl-1,4-benzoquinol methylase
MFAGIASRYDTLNHLLSLNIDKRWRRKVRERISAILGDPTAAVLDVACGTGDLTIEMATGANARVIGTDFCHPMLTIAAKKTAERKFNIAYLEADALCLPFATARFDAVTIAFGLRNLASVENGLAELHRVLKPGGTLIVLEFSTPVVPGFRQLFRAYFSHILPRLGGLVSGSRAAYEYLPASVQRFPDQEELAAMMRDAGLSAVTFQNLTGGIAAIHAGSKD